MGRRPRLDEPGVTHHVMNRGVNRQTTFFGDHDRVEFGRRLADVHDRFGIETIAYCLMGNHYHLVVRAPQGGLGSAMHHLGLVYTRRTNERVRRDGPLFRGRYHSIPITTDAYLLQAVRYVHRNPLDLPGVRRPADYRWSSYRTYLGHRRCPPFLDTGLVLGMFDGDREGLAAFTDDGRPTWVTTVEDLEQAVRLAIAEDDLRHGDDAEVQRWQERTAMLLVADALRGTTLARDVLERLDLPSAAARRMAMKRARDRAADPAIARIVRTVRPTIADRPAA